MAAAEGDANSEFFAALTSFLEDFIHKSLEDERTECIQRIVCLDEAALAILPTGFGKSVIYQLIPKVRMKKVHPSSGFKTSVVVVSPLEYIRRQKVENIKKGDCGINAAAEWLSDPWGKALRCGNLHRTKVLVVDEVSHSSNLVSLIQHDNVDVQADVFHARLE